MGSTESQPRSRWTTPCIAAFLGMALYLNLVQCATLRHVSLSEHRGSTTSVALPLSVQPGEYRVSFTLYHLPLSPSAFTLYVDDCVLGIAVNDQTLSDSSLPFCDFTRGRTISLDELTYGAHKIEVSIRNTSGPGSFDFIPTVSLASRISVRCLLIISIFLAVSYILTLFHGAPRAVRVSCILLSTLISLELLSRVFFSTPEVTAMLLDDGETSTRIRWLLKNRSKPVLNYAIDQYDPIRGWRLRSSLDGSPPSPPDVTSTQDGTRTVPGAKSPADPSAHRIMMFGDSFTFGEEVKDDESYPSIFAKSAPEVYVMNFGVHGYGHDQMLLYLKESIGTYKPQIVTLGFVRWDKERNMRAFRDYAKPRFILTHTSPKTLKLTHVPVPSPEELSRNYVRASRFGFLLSLVGSRIERRWNSAARTEEENELTQELLTEFASIVRQHEAIPLFVYLPDKAELENPKRSDLALFKTICQRASIICADTTPYFASRRDVSSLFHRGGHYTKAGNALVATAILQTLRAHPQFYRSLRSVP